MNQLLNELDIQKLKASISEIEKILINKKLEIILILDILDEQKIQLKEKTHFPLSEIKKPRFSPYRFRYKPRLVSDDLISLEKKLNSKSK